MTHKGQIRWLNRAIGWLLLVLFCLLPARGVLLGEAVIASSCTYTRARIILTSPDKQTHESIEVDLSSAPEGVYVTACGISLNGLAQAPAQPLGLPVADATIPFSLIWASFLAPDDPAIDGHISPLFQPPKSL